MPVGVKVGHTIVGEALQARAVGVHGVDIPAFRFGVASAHEGYPAVFTREGDSVSFDTARRVATAATQANTAAKTITGRWSVRLAMPPPSSLRGKDEPCVSANDGGSITPKVGVALHAI